MRLTRSLSIAAGFVLLFCVHRQSQAQLACTLGRVVERVSPQYPLPLQADARPIGGVVNVLATFAPNGRVTQSKVISGPAQLRYESEAYIRGWVAEPSSEVRECSIIIEYRFDSSQRVCGSSREVRVRAERQDDTHVLMHLGCDSW